MFITWTVPTQSQDRHPCHFTRAKFTANMTEFLDSQGKKDDGEDGFKKASFCFPNIKETDMSEEMKAETVELCVTACEKHSNNNENAARMVKETLDKKFGSSWHVVVGESFGLEVSHQVQTLLYMFFSGNLAICVWKCV